MPETWKVYKTTDSITWGHRVYEVSNLGRVKINGVITKPLTHSMGYKCIGGFLVHRAVAELFIPNPENKPFVDHIDTNRVNNHINNLRWVTNKENCNNPFTLQHRSDVMKGKNKGKTRSEETRRKLSESHKGKLCSKETKQKMREASKDRIWIHNGNEQRWINKSQLSLFLTEGWELGRK